MSIDRVAGLSQTRRNRMFNEATGRYDGETVVERSLVCIRLRRAGRLDALAGLEPSDNFGVAVRDLMLREEYERGYWQAIRFHRYLVNGGHRA